jgi:hypothetical protein
LLAFAAEPLRAVIIDRAYLVYAVLAAVAACDVAAVVPAKSTHKAPRLATRKPKLITTKQDVSDQIK